MQGWTRGLQIASMANPPPSERGLQGRLEKSRCAHLLHARQPPGHQGQWFPRTTNHWPAPWASCSHLVSAFLIWLPRAHQFLNPLNPRIVTDECPVGTKNWNQLPLSSPFLSRFSEASEEMPHPSGWRGRLLRGTMCWCSVHYQNSLERPIYFLISTGRPGILAGHGKLSRPLKGVLVFVLTL